MSRARGALLALVAGNQLGVPTEHLGTPEAIRKQFPAGVTDLAPPPKNSPYDDDAAMALLFGESLLAARGFDAADVARRWVKWMKVDGRGIGNTTKRALTLIDRGKEPFEAGRLVYQENPRFSAGNGCVMRCVPAALRYHDDLDRLIRVSTQQAAITHADERCTWGAAAVNLAARELLHGNIYFIDEVLHRIGDRAPRVLRDAIHRVPREREADRLPARSRATSCIASKSRSGLLRTIGRWKKRSCFSRKPVVTPTRTPRWQARCSARDTGKRHYLRAGWRRLSELRELGN